MKLHRGSSPYFCILAAVFTEEESAHASDRAIDMIRRQLRKPETYEFHFSHCPESVRTAFLRGVAPGQFSYQAFVIDKARLYSPKFHDAATFYEFAVNIVCDNAGKLMSNGKVVIDKNGNREFLQRLQCSLKQRVTPEGVRIVRKVAMQDSRSNNLVQLVVCVRQNADYRGCAEHA